MTRKEPLKRISIDPNIYFGKPCIRGTRIHVSLIVKNFAAGMSAKEILDVYPQLTCEDIEVALLCAVKEDDEDGGPKAVPQLS